MRVNEDNLIRWENTTVGVTAELVSRWLYTTASIDVYVDGNCVLRTGGVWRFWGTQSAVFTHDGKSHPAELSWGSGKNDFGYALKIDGQGVLKGRVRPDNMTAGLIPAGLAIALAMLFAHFKY